jgi:hypothetical protein
MTARMLWKTGALVVCAIPFLGATCTKEKLVDLVIGLETEAEFIASGSINTFEDEDSFVLAEEVDIEGALDDAGVNVSQLEPDAIKVARIFYKITQPEAGRSIENGLLQVRRIPPGGGGFGPPAILVSGFDADVSQATDWIDITDLVGAPGVTMLNEVFREVIEYLQAGSTGSTAFSTISYVVSGDSVPLDTPTDFQWRVKVLFQGKVAQEFELPDF